MEVKVTLDAPELAAAIFALADALSTGSWKAPAATPEKQPEPVKQPEPEKPDEPAKQPDPAPIKFEAVRAKMAQVKDAVGLERTKQLVAELGFDGLSKVTPDKYGELMARAEEVLHGAG